MILPLNVSDLVVGEAASEISEIKARGSAAKGTWNSPEDPGLGPYTHKDSSWPPVTLGPSNLMILTSVATHTQKAYTHIDIHK